MGCDASRLFRRLSTVLLVSDEFYTTLKKSISGSSKNIFITSAFIKERAVEQLFDTVSCDVKVSIVARWKKHDLLMGASDLGVYKRCQENGWKFGIDQNLHGKLFLIDDSDFFLGSANLTQKGMSLGGQSNLEFGTKFIAQNVDLDRMHIYKNSEVIWLTDEVFQKISADIEYSKSQEGGFDSAEWSIDVRELLASPVKFLWVSELIFSKPNQLAYLNLDDANMAHDFEMLNLDHDNFSKADIVYHFQQSRLYNWLRYQFSIQRSLNFGALSNALHNSLFDDPRPYRKEIKEFVTILFSWFEFLEDDFMVTKHNHTSSVKLKKD